MSTTYEFLKMIPFFADLSEEHLNWLCSMVEEIRLPAGKDLFAEGDAGDRAYVIKSGELEILKYSGGREVLIRVAHEREVIGEMALVEETPRTATVRARTDSLLLTISEENFNQLLNTSTSAARDMLHTVTSRWRATEVMLRQNEKMRQLGELTAGVAHELNNPAAAAQRGAGQLGSAFSQVQQAYLDLHALQLSQAQMDSLGRLDGQARDRAAQPGDLDSLDRSDREYGLENWLEKRGFEKAWELAPALVSLGYDTDDLADLARDFRPEQLPSVIAWLGGTYSVYSLLAEIGQGAERIAEIVKSLKSYSYLDQAPMQTVNVHEGLDNTLVMLRNKLKAGITVRREYAPDLPQILAYGSELNQVWTNVIDNAADSMQGQGVLTLRTRQEDNCVAVEIEDSGPGIPEAVQPRIFDAFFTTKGPSRGTGQGLNISYKIIVERHRGLIKVFSQPGMTCFEVTLPINFETGGGGAAAIATIERAGDEKMRSILETSKNIAVVGISAREDRPAHSVPAYLQTNGYRIIPVNPNLKEALGEKAYPDLKAVAEPVDVVQIFRPSEEVPAIVEQAIQIGAKAV